MQSFSSTRTPLPRCHILSLLLCTAVFWRSHSYVHGAPQRSLQVPPSPPRAPATFQLTKEQMKEYKTNGYIIIPQLLTKSQIKSSHDAITKMSRRRNLATRLLYKLFPSYGNLKFQTWRTNPALEEIAFDSPASSICASLMGLKNHPPLSGTLTKSTSTLTNHQEHQHHHKNNNTPGGGGGGSTSLRLLKDAVIGFQRGDKGCDWHVDDKIFWPCEDDKFGKPDAGINVWITLSPVSKKEGGGLALAKGSHVKKGWTKKARDVIAVRGPATTCLLHTLDEDSWERLEVLKQTHDLQPGDAIFHNRYLFHKVDPFFPHGDDDEQQKKKIRGMKHRISLRYMPADATYHPFEQEGSGGDNNDPVVQNKGLKRGDPISKAGEYFPQTWPHRLVEEQQKKVLAEPEFITLKRIFRMTQAMRKQKKKQQQQQQEEEEEEED